MDSNYLNKNSENGRASLSSFLQNINLKEIFSEDELEQILNDLKTIDDHFIVNSPATNGIKTSNQTLSYRMKKKSSFSTSKKVNEIMCDRTKLILNILKLSCEKLKQNNLNYLVKGVEW